MKKIFILALALSINLFFPAGCFAETVMFNTKTYKFHKPGCEWARKCTVNCIKIEKKEAVQRGGRPCKVCGG